MDFKKTALDNKILEVRVGSHLFGTDTPDSDLDLFGIFMPSEEMVYGFQRCEEVDLSVKSKDDTGRNTADAVDRKFHEFRKFVRLALQNNPNILHVLFVNEPNIVDIDPVYGKAVLEIAHLFPHKGAHHRFVKYAESQSHKMRIKPENYAKLEEGLKVLRGCSDNMVMAKCQNIRPFQYKGTGKHITLGDLNFEVGIYVKKARKMVEERLSKATNRMTLFTKYGYDVKFASNLIQLLKEGIEIMETGWVQMPLAYRQDVLDVKAGKYTAEEIMQWSEDLVEEARRAYDKSELPKETRAKEIEQFVVGQVREYLG